MFYTQYFRSSTKQITKKKKDKSQICVKLRHSGY